jgi:hypothetical protein
VKLVGNKLAENLGEGLETMNLALKKRAENS